MDPKIQLVDEAFEEEGSGWFLLQLLQGQLICQPLAAVSGRQWLGGFISEHVCDFPRSLPYFASFVNSLSICMYAIPFLLGNPPTATTICLPRKQISSIADKSLICFLNALFQIFAGVQNSQKSALCVILCITAFKVGLHNNMSALFLLRGRGSAIPPPPPGRGAQVPRGSPVTRGVLPIPPVTRGVPTPRTRGVPAVPGYRPPPPPAHDAYEEYVSTWWLFKHWNANHLNTCWLWWF